MSCLSSCLLTHPFGNVAVYIRRTGEASFLCAILAFIALTFFPSAGSIGLVAQRLVAQTHVKTKLTRFGAPRPSFLGLHVGMSEDSAHLLMLRIAKRRDTLHVSTPQGEMTMLESDSVRILSQPAYLQLQIFDHKIRTIVINYHPLGGAAYLTLRDQLDIYLERFFGKGVATTDESITYHRWETEDGTMEVSHSDKYLRMFVRLGKPRG